MGRLTLRQASLLDASGELGEPARQKLARRIVEDSKARDQYEAAQDNLAVLQILPMPEPSAAERRAIPAMIKKAIRLALLAKEATACDVPAPTGAGRAAGRSRWMVGAMALAACAVIVATLSLVNRSQNARQLAQIASINAAIDRVTMTPVRTPWEDDAMAGDATAASEQPLSETPALSYWRETLRILHDPLADTDGQPGTPDPSSPPG
jgi:hypothetical protein